MKGMADPWKDIAAEDAISYSPAIFKVPDGAQNVRWSVMESTNEETGKENPPLVEAYFELDGQPYIARTQVTGDS